MSELQFSKQFLTTLDNKATKYQPDHAFDPKTFATRVPYTLPKLSSPPHPSIPISPPTSSSVPASTTTDASNTTSSPPITLTLKSNRNPNMSLTLPSLAPTTTITHLKTAIQTHLGGPTVVHVDKIKIILNKKPIPSSKKTLADAFADTPELLQNPDGQVSLSVMVMGGAPDPPPAPVASQTTADTDAAAAASAGPESEKAAAEKAAADDAGRMEGVVPTGNAADAQGKEKVDEQLASPLFWSDLQAFLAQRLKVEEGTAGELSEVFQRAWRSGRERP